MSVTEIKAAVLAVCVVSAAKSLIGQTAGSVKMKDQLRLILDILLALVITAPFVSGFAGFELPEIGAYKLTDYDYSQELCDRALAEQTAANVCDILAEQLAAAGIDCGKISAEVNILSDGSISISRVTVNTEDTEGAAEVIHNTLGAETEVVNEGTW
ncbi:MAG: hypothetical protein Q4A05_01100 [Ruminococcus sp.]|nr:hypothetical protein [Ruminococcus sp.]